MKLPPDAFIAPEKVSDYLLRRRDEDDKSAFLALAGFTPGSPAGLLTAIRGSFFRSTRNPPGPFAYGTKLRVRGVLRGPNGRELRVVSIWATVSASGQTRFITLYPDKP